MVENLTFVRLQGELNREVMALAFDSRQVSDANTLFVAIGGFNADGHDHILEAIASGATIIIVERNLLINAPVTLLKVDNARAALARLSANFYDNPTQRLNLIGVTGTNGKTSTAYFIKSIYEQARTPTGVISTIGTQIGDKNNKHNHTTPEAPYLQQSFDSMLKNNIGNCVMEVSSHSLSLQRIDCSDFNIGVFTNLSPDHLEFHHNMEEYFQAKASLFQRTNKVNVLNADDQYGRRLVKMSKDLGTEFITYGIEQDADISAIHIKYFANYSIFMLRTPTGNLHIRVNFPGKIYVYNALAAISCAYVDGIRLMDIKAGIEAVTAIKGRLEVVYNSDDIKVIVDFAHTEDGLAKVLASIRPFVQGRIILVFGVYAAKGEKGNDKRRAMGGVAAHLADIAIVTSDNPKEQDPQYIVDEVAAAIDELGGNYYKIVDRKMAIENAIDLSEKGDVILIAGKGHETSQILGAYVMPFNEAQIVNQKIQSRSRHVVMK
ncbi:UDP-N-acetylmuramoyl-L-alanyl-D-glutamate--2,6-diaminopimelate ligase [Cohnella abietis]|uniref:UDP-N-acetylmuramoyl-L-alanyl-D-glutamate--2, 6-diaminopimelate ligase n=1 Tax=Cohnella abietis TaxID=2507935 RepID=UPI00138FC97B|nr:UDP-N-acetylmuramoyl-L-alanyl-D-glutamate--2,6-diaminopimelate ligase [Cohnella abietis]